MYFLETRAFSHMVTALTSFQNQQPLTDPIRVSCAVSIGSCQDPGSATDVTCVLQTSCELTQLLCVPLCFMTFTFLKNKPATI